QHRTTSPTHTRRALQTRSTHPTLQTTTATTPTTSMGATCIGATITNLIEQPSVDWRRSGELDCHRASFVHGGTRQQEQFLVKWTSNFGHYGLPVRFVLPLDDEFMEYSDRVGASAFGADARLLQ
ncbi:MAG: hypothetical protein ACRDTK_21515, partial [Mycobacterium sp.]